MHRLIPNHDCEGVDLHAKAASLVKIISYTGLAL
jgi:hypothetical protein